MDEELLTPTDDVLLLDPLDKLELPDDPLLADTTDWLDAVDDDDDVPSELLLELAGTVV